MASHVPPPGLAQLLTSTMWLGVPGAPHPMRSRLANRAGTMSSNVVPGRKKRPVFANSRSGPLPSPDREVPSAGYRGLIGSATTPSTTGNGATPSTPLATLQSSTDPAVDLVVGLGVPVLDLTVPLVQLASSIAIAAAVTRAEPRRVGRMTAVCHRLTPTGVHSCRRDGRSRGLAGDVSGFAPPRRGQPAYRGIVIRSARCG